MESKMDVRFQVIRVSMFLSILAHCMLLNAVKVEDIRTTLDFRVRECLATPQPGQCIRNRGLHIPNQSNIHRFVIYGGALNVNTTVHSSAPNDNAQQLNDDFTQLLISSGTRLNNRDGLGLTPLDYATKNTNMYWMLKRAGARHSTEISY